MNNETLLKISLLISISGIFSLLLISNITQPKLVESYSELKLNEQAKTTGKIISISSYDDFSVIKLNNNITLTCNCKFKQNETITATGKVTEYKNQLQIQAEIIKTQE